MLRNSKTESLFGWVSKFHIDIHQFLQLLSRTKISTKKYLRDQSKYQPPPH